MSSNAEKPTDNPLSYQPRKTHMLLTGQRIFFPLIPVYQNRMRGVIP